MTLGADLLAARPELFTALAAMLLLMVGVFRGAGGQRMLSWLVVLAVLVAAVLAMLGPDERTSAFNGLFVADDFGAFAKVLIAVGAALAVILSIDFNAREKIDQFEYPLLMLFAVLGMMLMVSANDLISLYVGLELQSLSLYVIAAIRRDALRSSEAGLKYFVLGALSSGLLLYGMSMVYGFAGTTSFDGLAEIFGGIASSEGQVPIGVVLGIVFVAAGLAFKVSAVPFHMWTPDVYEGAPTPVTAFFAVAPKIAAMALFVRVMLEPFGDLFTQWQQVIWAISVASMLLGSLAAIGQTNIKRLMAYSSIGHMGFALVGLAAGTETGAQGILLYLTVYLFMNVGTFAVILAMRRQGRMVEGINDLAGLGRTHPALAAALAIFMFSMAGIPPLAGFFGKFYVFIAAIQAELYQLAVIGLLASVISAFYYLRIVKVMYFDEPVERFDRPFGRKLSLVLVGTSIVTLFFFIALSPVLHETGRAAAALFAA
ncbi:MAG: NADH-quinone oxidoreductase subunit NuoN [Alphaproteobacteria bacterium]